MVEITIKNLRKTFGDVVATDDVNMVLEDGKLSTLLGPSGCGKTTLLRLIAGFYVPDRGQIFFDDREMTEILNLSVKTIETHRAAAMRKLNVTSTAAIVRYAIRNKLVEP